MTTFNLQEDDYLDYFGSCSTSVLLEGRMRFRRFRLESLKEVNDIVGGRVPFCGCLEGLGFRV